MCSSNPARNIPPDTLVTHQYYWLGNGSGDTGDCITNIHHKSIRSTPEICAPPTQHAIYHLILWWLTNIIGWVMVVVILVIVSPIFTTKVSDWHLRYVLQPSTQYTTSYYWWWKLVTHRYHCFVAILYHQFSPQKYQNDTSDICSSNPARNIPPDISLTHQHRSLQRMVLVSSNQIDNWDMCANPARNIPLVSHQYQYHQCIIYSGTREVVIKSTHHKVSHWHLRYVLKPSMQYTTCASNSPNFTNGTHDVQHGVVSTRTKSATGHPPDDYNRWQWWWSREDDEWQSGLGVVVPNSCSSVTNRRPVVTKSPQLRH